MTVIAIEAFFVRNKIDTTQNVKIDLKNRNPVEGQFVELADSEELKEKNFWRVVAAPNIKEWSQSKNINLTRIYSGTEFTRLSAL